MLLACKTCQVGSVLLSCDTTACTTLGRICILVNHLPVTTPSAWSGEAALAGGSELGLSARAGEAAAAAAVMTAAPAAAHHVPLLLLAEWLSVGADAAVAAAAVLTPCKLPVHVHGAIQCVLLGQRRCAASRERSNICAESTKRTTG
jgi:hypothetical protein